MHDPSELDLFVSRGEILETRFKPNFAQQRLENAATHQLHIPTIDVFTFEPGEQKDTHPIIVKNDIGVSDVKVDHPFADRSRPVAQDLCPFIAPALHINSIINFGNQVSFRWKVPV